MGQETMAKQITKRATWMTVLALCVATACTPIIRRHGFVPSETDLSQLTPGVSTRAEAVELLPPPTALGADGYDMYYVYSEFRTVGPLAPREVDRQIVAIDINTSGVVTGVTRYGLNDGMIVPLSQRVTNGNQADIGFLRQLMGSFGRIDPGALLGGR